MTMRRRAIVAVVVLALVVIAAVVVAARRPSTRLGLLERISSAEVCIEPVPHARYATLDGCFPLVGTPQGEPELGGLILVRFEPGRGVTEMRAPRAEELR